MNISTLPDKLANLITQPLVLVAMIVLVAAACITTSYQRLSLPPSQQTPATQSIANTNTITGLSSAEIIALNLFGAPSSAIQVKQHREHIPETKLKLVLKGAFSHSDHRQSSALITSDHGKRAELFMVGDELPGNAILEEVYADYVVLKRGIQLEKLQFARNSESDEKNNQTMRHSPASTDQAETYQSQKPDKATAPQSLSPARNTSKSTAEIREMIRQRN